MRYVVRWSATNRWSLSLFMTASLMAANLALPVQARSTIGLKYVYPDRVVQTYLEACGGTATDRVSQPVVQAICVCTITEFQNTFSLKEFRQMGQAIQAGQEVPVMDQIMLDCARQIMLPANG